MRRSSEPLERVLRADPRLIFAPGGRWAAVATVLRQLVDIERRAQWLDAREAGAELPELETPETDAELLAVFVRALGTEAVRRLEAGAHREIARGEAQRKAIAAEITGTEMRARPHVAQWIRDKATVRIAELQMMLAAVDARLERHRAALAMVPAAVEQHERTPRGTLEAILSIDPGTMLEFACAV